MALEKVNGDPSRTGTKLWVKMSIAKESLREKKTRAERLECELAIEVKEGRQSVLERR